MSALRDLMKCGDIREEYWMHVSDQGDLPLAPTQRKELSLPRLDAALRAIHWSEEYADEIVSAWLVEEPKILEDLRVIAGLSDKRLYLDLSYLLSRVTTVDGQGTLCGCLPQNLAKHSTGFFIRLLGAGKNDSTAIGNRVRTAEAISGYFRGKKLPSAVTVYQSLEPAVRQELLARWLGPKELQQNEAKRRGHGGEMVLARMLDELGCEFMPANKHESPMGTHDPNIDPVTMQIVTREAGRTFSSDIVLLDGTGVPCAFMMGLIQSSDPGQFGVNKSDEIVSIHNTIRAHNAKHDGKLELWGIVDGAGYSENKDGTVNKMIDNFDLFIQIRTLYKAALRAHILGAAQIKAIAFDMEFYSEKTRASMIERYVPSDVAVVGEEDIHRSGLRPVRAGSATVLF